MKKLLLPFFALLFLISCEKENHDDLIIEVERYEDGSANSRAPAPKIDVCHYDDENDTWKVINVNGNAWPAFEAQGDVQLIDNDGDGYVTSENECGIPVDCDDNDPSLTDNCCDGAEIDSNGPLFVAPQDEPGVYTWQEALDACAAKDLDGHTWYLPSKDELNDMHAAKEEIGCFGEGVYLSADEVEGDLEDRTWTQHFNTEFDGSQVKVTKVIPLPCRCVHR